MLIIYAFLIIVTVVFYEVVSFIVHIVYLVKISSMVDNINSKYDLLLLRLKDYEYCIAEVLDVKDIEFNCQIILEMVETGLS